MTRRPVYGAALFLLFVSVASFADIQYTETSRITGGVASGAMKFVGVFSKDARQATQGTNSIISVKGNKMRHESSMGTVEIYDLDARRVINIDLKHKTYGTMTFDELRARVEEAKRKAAEEQAKRGKGQNENVKITPKIRIAPGTGTKEILSYSAKEMKTTVDMEITSEDPKHKSETANTWVNSDAYFAPVKGHDEISRFYMKLAKELDWVPGTMMGSNAQIAQPMIEYRKSVTTMKGMPLLSYVSVGMGPNPGTTGQASAQATPEKKEGNVVTKGLGGMFGGMGKKKKEEPEQTSSGASGGSMMDMTIEVTSISNKALDPALFEVPAGFKQVEPKKDELR
jgi:hypothetical protein